MLLVAPPPTHALSAGSGHQVCAAAGSALFAEPERQRGGEKRKEKLLNEGETQGLFFFFFYVSPSGTDGTPANTWIVARESAMCPTDGPSKYEGTSRTDGQFFLPEHCFGTNLLKTEIRLMNILFLKTKKTALSHSVEMYTPRGTCAISHYWSIFSL